MAYTKVDYEAVEPRAPGMYFLRDALDCENLGVTVVECDPEWTGMEHDHADGGHEEVYLLLEGEVSLDVEGEAVDLDPGDAVRVPPGSTRQIHNGDEESLLVVAGAP